MASAESSELGVMPSERPSSSNKTWVVGQEKALTSRDLTRQASRKVLG